MKVWVAVAVARELGFSIMVGVGATKKLAEAKLVANLKTRWKEICEEEGLEPEDDGTQWINDMWGDDTGELAFAYEEEVAK